MKRSHTVQPITVYFLVDQLTDRYQPTYLHSTVHFLESELKLPEMCKNMIYIGIAIDLQRKVIGRKLK